MATANEIVPINPTTYEVTLAGGDKVEIGDREATKFKPHLKLNRWGGECFIAIQPAGEIESEFEPELEGGKIKYKYKVKQQGFELELESEFYPLEPRTVIAKDKDGRDRQFTQNELGGFEFTLTLEKKPTTNQITFDIQTQGLRFSYQPPLTQKEIDDGAIRPENVVGSYAVYHATRGNMHASQADAEKYKTGKAFHIYRPHLVDAHGAEAWANLNISDGALTITLPQEFLNAAVYPVTIDPDLGETAIGGTPLVFVDSSNTYRVGSAWTMPQAGTANYIKAYFGGDDAVDVKACINQKDSGGVGEHGQIAIKTNNNCVAAPHWEQFTLADEPLTSGVTYILNFKGNPDDLAIFDNYNCYYDANGAVASYKTLDTWVPDDDPCHLAPPEGTTNDYSIYCNYSEVAVGIENKSANMAAKMVAAGLI